MGLGAPNTSSNLAAAKKKSPMIRDAGNATVVFVKKSILGAVSGRGKKNALMLNTIAPNTYPTATTYVASRYEKVVRIRRNCGLLILSRPNSVCESLFTSALSAHVLGMLYDQSPKMRNLTIPLFGIGG